MSARYVQLETMVKAKGWESGAELGLFDGRTFLHLLQYCPRLFLIGVDVWGRVGFAEGASKSGEMCHCAYCEETRAARRRLPTDRLRREHVIEKAARFGKRAKIYDATTSEVAKLVPAHSLDFVFIDADHSTEGVARDVAEWLPKVAPGGMLLGHDWNMRSVREGALLGFGGPEPEILRFDDHVWGVQC